MLTFPIAADLFANGLCKHRFQNAEREFDGLRESADEGDPTLLYVYPAADGTVIGSGGDSLLLPGVNPHVVYSRLAAEIESLERWERRLGQIVFSESSLQDIIDISVPIFHNAIMITDESNRILAMSAHGPGEVSTEWDYMLQNRSTELGLVLDIFRAEPFKRHAFSGDGKPFYFVPPGLKTGGINCRIPAPDGKSVLGTALITTDITPVSDGMLHKARVFSEAVCRWVRLHHRELPMGSAPAVFLETLEGKLLTDNRALLLYTAMLPDGDDYRLLCVSELPRLMLDTCVRSMEAALLNAVCAQSGGRIYVLLGEREYARQIDAVSRIIDGTGACIGLSHCFTDLHLLGEYAQQAKTAAAYGKGTVRPLTAESVMRYTAAQMQKTPLRASIVHPALLSLDEYDRAHDTEFCKTLFVYLIHERSIAASLPTLNIHRNTLIYRLKRMESIMSVDLNDPAEREYLLLSFRLLRLLPNND